jgi:hypothetical protein
VTPASWRSWPPLRFTHLIAGFDNRTLTELAGALLGVPCTSRHATYDLRRLRRKQIIERLPGTYRYRLTAHGRAIAVLFTKTYGRVLTPASPPSTLPSLTILRAAHRSPPPGGNSTAPSTGTSQPGWPPHDRRNLI